MDFVDFLSRVYRDNRILILAVTCACQYGILLGLAALMARHWFGRGLGAYAGYSAPPAWAMGMAVLGAIIIMPAVDLASYLSYRLFPAFERLGSAAAALYRWETPAQAALIWLAISVTPAICEEFLFRGILQRGLQRRLAFPWSVLASGVIFALYHQSALALPALALVGAFIGLMYWASGSIWPGMAFHALYNGAVLCMVNYEERLPAWLLRGEYFNPALWAVGVAATGLIAFALVGAGLKRKGRGPEEGAGAAAST
jgi:membrane protease YdiL (CAAX protease family)